MSCVLNSTTFKQARNCEFCLPIAFRLSNPFHRIITRSFITIRPSPVFSPLSRPPRRQVRPPVEIWSEELRKLNARPRGIHCSVRTQLAPFVYIAGILKTSTSLGVPHFIGRVVLSFFPVVMLKRKFMLFLLKIPEESRSQIYKIIGKRGGMDLVKRFRVMNMYLAVAWLTPIVLFAAIILAGLERTPLTGRVRLILLSPEEEGEISNDLARDGWTRDVFNILSSNSDVPPRIVPPHDWRWKWVDRTLRRLEASVPILLDDKGYRTMYEHQAAEALPMPPPLDYPLEPRPLAQQTTTGADSPSATEDKTPPDINRLGPPYTLLVVENPEPNAFSYGFGGNGGGGVVVYTGFIDEVMGSSPAPEVTPSPLPPQGILASLFSIKPTPQSRSDPLPTISQTTQLATLLSHELSHLLLSHHLETLSFGTVLIPRVNAIMSDILRVVLFPFTLMFGPWLGDAINNVGRVGLGEITQSGVACASRKLEIEADIISARLLAISGFDPRAAVSFWESRLNSRPTKEQLSSLPPSPPSASDPSDTSPSRFLKAADSMSSTHPVDEKRVMMLEQELQRWQKQKDQLLAKRRAVTS